MKILLVAVVLSVAAFGVGQPLQAQVATAPAIPPAANAAAAGEPADSANVAGDTTTGDSAAVPPVADGNAEVVRDRFPDGNVRVERHVIRGPNNAYVSHGAWTAFYPDGRKIGGGEYVKGKRHGTWSRWFNPGEAPLLSGPPYAGFHWPYKSTASFVDGEIDGVWAIADSEGQKISEWNFVGGKPQGTWSWWHPNGQKRREMTYQAGVLTGNEFEWDPEGKVISKAEYIGRRKKVFVEAWYSPGVKHWEGWYLEPREITKTEYQWWEGRGSTAVVQVEGRRQRVGQWTWYFPNGQKQSAGPYVNGQMHGEWKWWHPGGETWISGSYAAGKQAGQWTWLHPDGSVEKEQTFPLAAPLEAPASDAATAPAADSARTASRTGATKGGVAPPQTAPVPFGPANPLE